MRMYPDFLFPQMQQPELAPPAGSLHRLPLPVVHQRHLLCRQRRHPLTRWAKTMMMLQSAVSVAAIALVVARAVNILR